MRVFRCNSKRIQRARPDDLLAEDVVDKESGAGGCEFAEAGVPVLGVVGVVEVGGTVERTGFGKSEIGMV
jgi:hypothetical protein